MTQEEATVLLNAIYRAVMVPHHREIPKADLERFGKNQVYVGVYNKRKWADTMEEVVDSVREALGQKETHYLCVASDVEALRKEFERVRVRKVTS